MGEKALTLAYASGFLNAIVSAPCPPIECPVIRARRMLVATSSSALRTLVS
jgi:hypothetical protein